MFFILYIVSEEVYILHYPKKKKREVLLVKLKYHKICIQVGLLKRSPEDSLKKEK
jgi:hypothetical protein